MVGMRYLLGGLVIAFIFIMLIGGLTGRFRARSCCSVADPASDSRMRDVFETSQAPEKITTLDASN